MDNENKDNENLDKKMEFIVEHQAHLTVKMEQLEELLAGLMHATFERFEASDKRADSVDEKIAALVDAQLRTEESVRQTNENLNNLIAVVDRYFSEGRNGISKK